MGGRAYYEYIVNDNNTAMRNYLTHLGKKQAAKNIGGRLPKDMHVPWRFTDPAHFAKHVSGVLFELVKVVKGIKRLDALILKKYYVYYININRKKSLGHKIK